MGDNAEKSMIRFEHEQDHSLFRTGTISLGNVFCNSAGEMLQRVVIAQIIFHQTTIRQGAVEAGVLI